MKNNTYTGIEGLSEFAEPTVPPTAPAQTPPPQTAPTGVTREELSASIEKARTEEKKKLYAQIEKEKQRTVDAQAQAKKAQAEAEALKASEMSGEQRIQDQLKRMQDEIKERDERLQSALAKQEADRKSYELSIYREKVLREAGPTVMPDLVRGASQAEIDQSVLVARAEYAHWQKHFQTQFAAAQVPPQTQPAPTPTEVMAGVPQPVPAPAPTMTAPAPQGQPAINGGDIAAMTSEQAVRNGSYAKNREAILARVRQGVPAPGTQLPMRPMIANQPQPQAVVPQQQAFMPHTQQPGGVMQPQGLPTPPVQNPNIPQGASMAMPSVQPQGQPDPQAAMRAQAEASAIAALANPSAAIAQSGATDVPQVTPGFESVPSSVPQGAMLGAHPQIR